MIGELDVFHVGVVVDDLEASMARIGATFGIGWAQAQERVQVVRTGAGEVRNEPIRFVYSATAQGPLHIELIQSDAGSIWETSPPGALHHVGAYADDVTKPPTPEHTLEFGGGDQATPLGFAYYIAPSGLRVELVDSSRRELFKGWFDGGEWAPPKRAN